MSGKFLLSLAAVFHLIAAGYASAEADKDAVGSQLVRLKIAAPSLANNTVNEPDTQPILVYLPPSYNRGDKAYPVVYFLPGYTCTVERFSSGSFQGLSVKDAMDSLISQGKIKEMIVVVVNGHNVLNGSFYANSATTGNWEDFVVKDTVGYIDKNFRTIRKPGSRGISGHSMGGSGSVNIAMNHSDVFGALYSMSPGMFDETGLREAMSQIIERNWMGRWDDSFKKAYGAAFASNNTLSYPHGEVPSDSDDPAWTKWENGFGNLKNKIKNRKANLLKLKGIAVDVGTSDEYLWIPKGVRYFSSLLKAEGISHELMEFNGGHIDQVRTRFENYMLPFFSRILDSNR